MLGRFDSPPDGCGGGSGAARISFDADTRDVAAARAGESRKATHPL